MDQSRVERVREIGYEHARIETEGDLPGTMATLIASPVYEFQPVGALLRGRDAVERYYEHLMAHFLPHVENAVVIEEWCNETSLAQEYDVDVRIDGVLERHRVAGILLVEGDLLRGERIWGGERILRLMLGDALYDGLEAGSAG